MRTNKILKDFNMRKHFILTKPSKIHDITLDDLFDDEDYNWREKARQLQIRRWRKVKHQLS